MQSTAPVDVPVVDAAKTPHVDGPKRTSLPSMLPPVCVADWLWSAPTAVSRGLPFCSTIAVATENTIQNANITTSSTRPCRFEPASTPNVTVIENGMRSRR